MTHRHGFMRSALTAVWATAAVLGSSPALAGEVGDAVSNVEADVLERKRPSDPDSIVYGGRGVTGKSAIAGLCSLIIPGIGQALNRNPTKKVVTHAGLGLLSFVALAHPVGIVFGLFHIWSFWDALIDRPGGYINGCVQAPVGDTWLDASITTPVGGDVIVAV